MPLNVAYDFVNGYLKSLHEVCPRVTPLAIGFDELPANGNAIEFQYPDGPFHNTYSWKSKSKFCTFTIVFADRRVSEDLRRR